MNLAAWEHWQASVVSQALLTPEARHQGYTVIQVPPCAREAFLEFARVLTTYASLAQHGPTDPAVIEAWHRWRTLTRRLGAALRRLRAGQSATFPSPLCPQEVPDAAAHHAFPLG
jgi:hypothetical protein